MKKSLVLVGVVSFFVFLTAGRAYGGSIMIYDTTNEPWTVSWTDPRVISVTDTTVRAANDPTAQTTTLTKVADFTQAAGFAPIVLTFTENAVAANSVGGKAGPAASDGLNFVITNDIFNNTGVKWATFSETLEDHDLLEEAGVLTPGIVLASNGAGSHPAVSHFHTPVTINDPAAWSLANSPNSGQNVLLAQSSLLEDTELIFSVKIHDILVNPFERSFTLTEAPAPEPASLALVALALAGLGMSRRKKA
jgi:PEP-CTERM motif